MSGERILVIDDSREIVRHLAEQVLPSYGYQPLFAYDGRTGLEMIRTEKPDLVMLDLNLPEMNGLDVLGAVARDALDVPVILMTGYGSEKSAVQAFRLGAKDYLVKPFTVEELAETIDNALMEARLREDNERLAERLRRLNAAMRRQVSETSTLAGIGKSVTAQLDVDKVIGRVLEAARYLTSAEVSVIWMVDEATQQFHAFTSQPADRPPLPSLDMAADVELLNEVMEAKQPLRRVAFSGEGIPIGNGFYARALMCTSLDVEGTALGVLGVANRSAPRSFSQQDEWLLSILAGYAAVGLRNSQRFERADRALNERTEELSTLVEITRTISSSLDLDEVVAVTINLVYKFWEIDACSVWLLDEESQSLRLVENVGTPRQVLAELSVPLEGSILGHVARTGEWVCTNDVASDPSHYRLVDEKTGFQTNSLLCVPLTFRQRVIGAMELLNKHNGDFDETDVERALSIALAVATAVSNALLFREAESRKQLLEVTLEHNGNPVIITDMEGRLLLLNQRARNRLRLTRAAVGQPAAAVLEPPELAQFLIQPLADEESKRMETTLADESVWLSTLAPIPDYGRILLLQDITYLKDLDKAKDEFLATISHDLRAPLNSVIGFAQTLREVGPVTEQQAVFVDRIINSSQRMTDLVNALLDLAKVNARLQLVRQPCDLSQLSHNVLVDLQGQALTRQIELALRVADVLPPVYGDPTQLRQAISNLLDNAIKYSPPGGSVVMELAAEDEDVLVRVIDSGRGIASDDLPFIFDEFYRVQAGDGVGGVGLGLTLVRSIAEAHNGRVCVDSHTGTGSTFTLVLPAAPRESVPAVE